MKIAVSMITLNEEQFIGAAIPSLDFADYIVIADGGSTDRTIDVIKEKLEEMKDPPEVILDTFLWEDHFGDQRQKSLDMIPDDVGWWIRCDADETFSHAIRKNIRTVAAMLPDDMMGVAIRQTNLLTDVRHYVPNYGGFETWPRMFRHMLLPSGESALKWVDPIHEHVKFLGPNGLHDISPKNIVRWSAQVYHRGWLKDERREEREVLYERITNVPQNLRNRGYILREVPESVIGPVVK